MPIGIETYKGGVKKEGLFTACKRMLDRRISDLKKKKELVENFGASLVTQEREELLHGLDKKKECISARAELEREERFTSAVIPLEDGDVETDSVAIYCYTTCPE